MKVFTLTPLLLSLATVTDAMLLQRASADSRVSRKVCDRTDPDRWANCKRDAVKLTTCDGAVYGHKNCCDDPTRPGGDAACCNKQGCRCQWSLKREGFEETGLCVDRGTTLVPESQYTTPKNNAMYYLTSDALTESGEYDSFHMEFYARYRCDSAVDPFTKILKRSTCNKRDFMPARLCFTAENLPLSVDASGNAV